MARYVWAVGAVWALAALAGCTERSTAPDHPDAAALFDAAPGDAALVRDVGTDAGGASCRTDSDCTDRLACTIDHCTAGACEHVPCTDCCGAGRSCDPSAGCGPTPVPCTVDGDCMDAVPCTLDACRSGFCRHEPQDALCSGGQICIAAVGCGPRPPDHCTTDADCAAIGFCYGTWTCAGEVGCAFVGPTDCDDAEACTTDRCDLAGGACAHDATDADHDLHTATGCLAGDDCDDTVASTHPGAAEACNGVDDDCDAVTDEGCCASGPCTTSCHTTGTSGCNPDGTVGACIPPVEECNGADDDCDAAIDEDFECVRGATASCTTGCTTSGTTTCDAACHSGACMPPAETCNGMDDDCDGTADDGFGCVLGSTTSCPTTCSSVGTQTCIAGCTYGACAPPAETCNGVDDNCNGARDDGLGLCYRGETEPCTLLGYASGTALCRTDCSAFDPATCSNCGNNTVDPGEACDGVALGGQTCVSRGYAGGMLRCAAGCALDESGCTHCGDGIRDLGEQCDGTALGGATCASQGFTGGTLRCATGCTYDTTLCTRCGNGLIETGELCDGALVGGATCGSVMHGYTGTLRCASGCASYDTSMCRWTPSGTWSITPTINYNCAGSAVNFSFGLLTFSDVGGTLTVSGGGLNCDMTGASALVSRMVDVQCSQLGDCDETYHLVGTFTADNTFSVTSFTATFTDTTGTGFACFGCSTRTFTGRTGSR